MKDQNGLGSIYKQGYEHLRDEEKRVERERQLRDIAAGYGRRDLGDEAVNQGYSPSQLHRAVLESIAYSQKLKGDIDMTRREVSQYSVCRWLSAVARDPQDALNSTLEGQASKAVAESLGRSGDIDLKQIFVPRQILQRDLTAASPGAGGFTVGSPVGSFSQSLHSASVLGRLGVEVVGPLVGAPTMPVFDYSSVTTSWLPGEAAEAQVSEPAVGELAVSPRHVSVYGKVSRQLSKQAQENPSVEQLVLNGYARVLASEVDAQALSGDGAAGRPLGLLNTSSIGTFTGASLDYSAIVNAMLDVANADAIVNPGSVGFVTTPAVAGLLKERYVAAATESDRAIWQGSVHDGMIEGHRAISSNACPAAVMVHGDWSQIMLAEWGVLQLEADPFTDFRAGRIGLRAIWSIDVGVRHAASFTVATSVT
jgi:HK97 family phage major capsid protein